MPVAPPPAALIIAAAFAAISLQARADDRTQLNACQTQVDRAATQEAGGPGSKPDDAELQRCRQIIREWTLRDSRMTVDEHGRSMR